MNQHRADPNSPTVLTHYERNRTMKKAATIIQFNKADKDWAELNDLFTQICSIPIMDDCRALVVKANEMHDGMDVETQAALLRGAVMLATDEPRSAMIFKALDILQPGAPEIAAPRSFGPVRLSVCGGDLTFRNRTDVTRFALSTADHLSNTLCVMREQGQDTDSVQRQIMIECVGDMATTLQCAIDAVLWTPPPQDESPSQENSASGLKREEADAGLFISKERRMLGLEACWKVDAITELLWENLGTEMSSGRERLMEDMAKRCRKLVCVVMSVLDNDDDIEGLTARLEGGAA